MARLKLYFLGSFYATLDGELLIEFRSDKARALLAYLLLEASQPIHRNILKKLLWDGYDSKSASLSLRVTLSNLSKLLKPLDLLTITRQTVQFNFLSDVYWCDVIEFVELCQNKAVTRQVLQQIKLLYRGEFLSGLVLDDSSPFEMWRKQQAIILQAQQAQLFPDNLPRQMTTFIGREDEILDVTAKVLDVNYPLVTILGEGGIGKTRLALAVVQKVRGHFLDGIYFVSLAHLQSPTSKEELENNLASLIAEALGLNFYGDESLKKQLFTYIYDKELLLVLDSFEQLLEGNGADFVSELLQETQQVQVLVSSRERLNLQAEYIFRINGLPVPPFPTSQSKNKAQLLIEIQSLKNNYGSLQLFVERANRYQRFVLDESNQNAVIQICQLVEGLPLAIELAAALTEVQLINDIAHSIQEALDLLATTKRDHLPRHRNIRAAFEYSWRLLSKHEQLILARCSVFSTAFSQEAVKAITFATKEDLIALVNKSLLREQSTTEGVARYDMHELVRQFAAEKLKGLKLNEEEQVPDVRERYSCYYLDLIAHHEAELLRSDPQFLSQMRIELCHIRQAWQWAVSFNHFILIERSLMTFSLLYQTFALIQEGEILISHALNGFPNLPTLRYQLLVQQATFQDGLANYESAIAALQEATSHPSPESSANAEAYLRWGIILWHQSQLQEAQERLENAVYLYQMREQSLITKWGLSESLNYLALVCQFQGEMTRALDYFEQALIIKEAILDQRGKSYIFKNLAVNYGLQGDYAQALLYLEQALQIWRTIGNQRDQNIGLSNLGFAYYILGDYAKAETFYCEALSQSRLIGDKRVECSTLSNLALLMNRCDNQQKGLFYAQEAFKLSSKISYDYLQSEALINLGHIYLSLGNHMQANKNYQEAFLLRKKMQRLSLAMEAKAGLAKVALLKGLLEEAKGHMTELLTYLEGNPTLLGVNEPMPVFLTGYQVLAADKDERSMSLLESTYNLLCKRAAKISDEKLRESYLKNVSAHREIVDLWEKQVKGSFD